MEGKGNDLEEPRSDHETDGMCGNDGEPGTPAPWPCSQDRPPAGGCSHAFLKMRGRSRMALEYGPGVEEGG